MSSGIAIIRLHELAPASTCIHQELETRNRLSWNLSQWKDGLGTSRLESGRCDTEYKVFIHPSFRKLRATGAYPILEASIADQTPRLLVRDRGGHITVDATVTFSVTKYRVLVPSSLCAPSKDIFAGKRGITHKLRIFVFLLIQRRGRST